METTKTREQRMADQVDQIKDLQAKQMAAHNGDESAIKMIPANRDKEYEIKEYEKDYVHVAAISRIHNEATKEYKEEKRIIKIQPNNLDTMAASGAFNVYDDVKVIHDPRPGKAKEVKLKTTEPSVAQAKPSQREKELEDRLAKLEAQLSAKEKGKAPVAESLPDLDEEQPAKSKNSGGKK